MLVCIIDKNNLKTQVSSSTTGKITNKTKKKKSSRDGYWLVCPLKQQIR